MIKYVCSEWSSSEEKIDVIVKGYYRNFSGHAKMDHMLYEVISKVIYIYTYIHKILNCIKFS